MAPLSPCRKAQIFARLIDRSLQLEMCLSCGKPQYLGSWFVECVLEQYVCLSVLRFDIRSLLHAGGWRGRPTRQNRSDGCVQLTGAAGVAKRNEHLSEALANLQ